MHRTDAEWQALSARLAREVMGFEEQDAYGEGILFWVSETDKEYLVEEPDSYAWMDWEVWEPYLDVAQAMRVLDRIVARGCDASLKIHHHDSQREVWLTPPECRGPCRLGIDDSLASAICLAAEAWLDRDKEAADATQ